MAADNTTAPFWYDGLTPWESLTPAQRLYESITAGDATDADVQMAGFRWSTPNWPRLKHSEMYEASSYSIPSVAVLMFAYRNRDDEELAEAVRWLTEHSYLSPLEMADGK